MVIFFRYIAILDKLSEMRNNILTRVRKSDIILPIKLTKNERSDVCVKYAKNGYVPRDARIIVATARSWEERGGGALCAARSSVIKMMCIFAEGGHIAPYAARPSDI